MTAFWFAEAKKAEHSIQTMRRVLEVSRSGFHAWQRREPCQCAREDARLLTRVQQIHKDNRRVYGAPRIHAELVLGDGERIGRKRVERLIAPGRSQWLGATPAGPHHDPSTWRQGV